jgi:hypothetical protein
VLVHCPSRLGTTAAVLAAKLLRGDGVFAKWAFERRKTVYHFDGVISHSFKGSRLSGYDSELKLPSPVVRDELRCSGCLSPAVFVRSVDP